MLNILILSHCTWWWCNADHCPKTQKNFTNVLVPLGTDQYQNVKHTSNAKRFVFSDKLCVITELKTRHQRQELQRQLNLTYCNYTLYEYGRWRKSSKKVIATISTCQGNVPEKVAVLFQAIVMCFENRKDEGKLKESHCNSINNLSRKCARKSCCFISDNHNVFCE